MDTLFSDTFVKSLKKHAHIKRAVQKKVDMILKDPMRLGEPLKGNLRGYYSAPVKGNFLIIYLYCRACRKRRDDEVVGCKDCGDCADETVKFIALGPHDKVYREP